VFARRAVEHALSQPAPPPRAPQGAELEELRALPALAPAGRSTREALWERAGVVRDAAGLERLLHDPYPLARIIARCALARTESRGAHLRSDHPQLDPAFDGRHAVVGEQEPPEWQSWS
jgi:L-aspartate oxidase